MKEIQFRNAKSKIERKFQDYSERTLKFERIPRESERTLEFDFLAKMTCFYTIQHLFKQKSKIEREFFSMINLRKICQKCNSASIQAKSKIERKFQEYSEKTLKFEKIPREL